MNNHSPQLIYALSEAILNTDAGPEYAELLKREKLRTLSKVDWSPEEKIYAYKKGDKTYFKINTPVQKSSKNKDVLIQAAFENYFPEAIAKNSITVSDCFELQMKLFDTAILKEARSEETASIYRRDFYRFFVDYPANVEDPSSKEPLGSKPISSLKKSYIHQYLENLVNDFHLNRDSLRNAKTALSKAFIYATNNDIIELNPLSNITTSDIITFEEKTSIIEAYPAEDLVRLLDVMTDEAVLSSYRKGTLAREAAAALCLETQLSIRAGETRAFKVSDICLDPGKESISIHSFIRDRRNKDDKDVYQYRPVTKSRSRNGDRNPGLSDFAISIISDTIARHPDDEYLFSSNGHPLPVNTLPKWLRKFCAIAGVKYRRPHCLRSSAISELNDGNIGKGRIQHTAGHLNPETTNRYIDHTKSSEITREEANRIYPKPSKFKD